MSTKGRYPRRHGEEPATLVLQIELEPGRELRGSIGRANESISVPFHGWIDFMAAVSLLRDAES